ncbi:6-carboxytetrahydropterin synthase QueD [Rhodoferax koreense]|uniref:6-carboxy-5,6,7,8-tetrahydropterin synthase n=1 Tax=Rhodoferax koreensis TaxID=1842727 RepID=A0A1P8JQ13_9BURK|nr:6-carboxytetrahydropterin synthase [Rhodoferax koreense]APW35815.1 6-carboxytetrahydropterin synthase QueD [Rhodoferax koreense]
MSQPHTPGTEALLGRFEVSQRFFFDAAHTLQREIEAESSARIHGHTYHAEVTLAGQPDPQTGMVVDLGQVRAHIATLREQLDHRLLDEVPGLGVPTLENLCRFIADGMASYASMLSAVRVWRESTGDGCVLRLG